MINTFMHLGEINRSFLSYFFQLLTKDFISSDGKIISIQTTNVKILLNLKEVLYKYVKRNVSISFGYATSFYGIKDKRICNNMCYDDLRRILEE